MVTIQVYTKDEVLQKICYHFGVKPEYFLTKSRKRSEVCFIRQVYTYCLERYTDMNTWEIGDEIKRNRSIVSSTKDCIAKRCSVDREFRDKIIEIESLFEQ